MKQCLLCNHVVTSVSFFYQEVLCQVCRQSLQPQMKKQKWRGYSLVTIYPYQPQVRSLLLAIKQHHDYALARVLLSPYGWYLRLVFLGYRVVLAPTTAGQTSKRGFHPLQAMLQAINVRGYELFVKDELWKQSEKNRQQRKEVKNYIRLIGRVDPKRRYVLIDDVITSGETLMACVNLLVKQGVKKIKVVAICDNHHPRR